MALEHDGGGLAPGIEPARLPSGFDRQEPVTD
jgi:hypothetical protein